MEGRATDDQEDLPAVDPVALPAPLRRRVTRANGRAVAYAEVGDPAGRPLVYFHGTPNSRLDAVAFAPAFRAAGIRAIAIDRPGMGRSDPQPHRRLLDAPADVAAVLDPLGIDRFVALGYSGGGPYAWACAHELGTRVEAVVTIAGSGRPDRPGASKGMDLLDRQLDLLAHRAPVLARSVLATSTWWLRRSNVLGADAITSTLVGGDEQAIAELARHGLRPVDPVLEAFRQGTGGAVDDLRLLLEPWGFSVTDLPAAVAVQLWHGERDVSVPVHHSADLARLVPRAEFHRLEGEGHNMAYRRMPEILAALPKPTAAASPPTTRSSAPPADPL